MIEFLEPLRETWGTNTLVVVSALLIGLIFGVVAEISGYCTRAAVAEWADNKSQSSKYDKTLSVLAAIAMAIAGTSALAWFGLIDLSETIYWATTIKPLALIVGGTLFGIGMVLAGGCVSRLLVLAASGNARSWVTLLVTGVAAYATLRGILSYPRIWLEEAADTGVTTASVYEGNSIGFIVAALALAVLVSVSVALIRNNTNGSPAQALLAGLVIGALVVFGWVATGIVGADDFEPTALASLSFVAPVGESIQYLMIYTGDTIRFSIALVGGVLVGAFVSSLVNRRFAFIGFTDQPSLLRYAAGGALMGFGGVTALGCTVGQGLSGISTGSPASLLAFASIVIAAFATIKFRQRTVSENVPVASLA